MILRLLALAVVAGSAIACASGSGRASRAECMNPGDPIGFGIAFTDSARAAGILMPLLRAAGDTVYATVAGGGAQRFAFIDTVAVPDSTARNALEERLAAIARPPMPMRSIEIQLFHDAGGAPRFTAQSVAGCPPELENAAELRRALQRSASVIRRSGTSIVWIPVDETGTPERVQVSQSSGDPDIDASAMAVAYVARFQPAVRAGRPVRVWVQILDSFRLVTMRFTPARFDGEPVAFRIGLPLEFASRD